MRSSILVVDDSSVVIHLVSTILEEYHLSFAMSGEEALGIIKKNPHFELILLDVEMPGMDGYELISKLKEIEGVKDIPVIFLTVKDNADEEVKGIALGAVDYIKKPINKAILKARVETHVNLMLNKVFINQQNEILENKVRQRTREILITQDFTIKSMMSLLEVRDLESGQHITRIQQYIKLLCENLSQVGPYTHIMTEESLYNISRSSPLHDIGKIGIPDEILLKPGKLTTEEFEIMKKHTYYAIKAFSCTNETLGNMNFLNTAREIAGSHHERWDGTGYPFGLKGLEIPLAGRCMAIADVYDALISKRVYKEAFPHRETVDIILKGRGTHFDPAIVDAFINLESDFEKIAIENMKSRKSHEEN